MQRICLLLMDLFRKKHLLMTYEIDYLALGPEIAVALTIMAVLTLDLLLPKSQKYWTGVVAVVGMMAAAVPLIALIADGTTRTMLDGSWVVDPFALASCGGSSPRCSSTATRAR